MNSMDLLFYNLYVRGGNAIFWNNKLGKVFHCSNLIVPLNRNCFDKNCTMFKLVVAGKGIVTSALLVAKGPQVLVPSCKLCLICE